MKFLYLFFILILLNGCFAGRSKKPNFYTLESIEMVDKKPVNKKVLIKVKLSNYIDRPQIVLLKNNKVEYKIDEFNRWVESPVNLIQKTMVNNLSKIFVVKNYDFADKNFDYIIDVYVDKIDIMIGESIYFKAKYNLLDKNKKVILSRQYEKTLNIDDGYVDVVKKLSLILSDFGNNVANFL